VAKGLDDKPVSFINTYCKISYDPGGSLNSIFPSLGIKQRIALTMYERK